MSFNIKSTNSVLSMFLIIIVFNSRYSLKQHPRLPLSLNSLGSTSQALSCTSLFLFYHSLIVNILGSSSSHFTSGKRKFTITIYCNFYSFIFPFYIFFFITSSTSVGSSSSHLTSGSKLESNFKISVLIVHQNAKLFVGLVVYKYKVFCSSLPTYSFILLLIYKFNKVLHIKVITTKVFSSFLISIRPLPFFS